MAKRAGLCGARADPTDTSTPPGAAPPLPPASFRNPFRLYFLASRQSVTDKIKFTKEFSPIEKASGAAPPSPDLLLPPKVRAERPRGRGGPAGAGGFPGLGHPTGWPEGSVKAGAFPGAGGGREGAGRVCSELLCRTWGRVAGPSAGKGGPHRRPPRSRRPIPLLGKFVTAIFWQKNFPSAAKLFLGYLAFIFPQVSRKFLFL